MNGDGRVNLVRAGDVYLNFDRVSMVRRQRGPAHELTGELLVYFHRDRRARLRGVEADALGRYLDANALGAEDGPPRGSGDSGGLEVDPERAG